MMATSAVPSTSVTVNLSVSSNATSSSGALQDGFLSHRLDVDGIGAQTPATDGMQHGDRPRVASPAPTASSSAGAVSPSGSRGSNSLPLVSSMGEPEPDPAILEALRSAKERLYVLKLADSLETLIHERNSGKINGRTTLHPTTTYQRLLIHRCSAYYRITPEPDQATKTIIVHVNLESRIPVRRIAELVPAESSSSLPTFKIMRRTTPDQRTKARTTVSSSTPLSTLSASDAIPFELVTSPITGNVEVGSPIMNGVEGDDVDSVLASLGLQGPKTRTSAGSSTPRKTIEEREAAYLEAKRRIFSDFSEKEKEAAKLREDREREREVRELHRDLAAEEEEEIRTGYSAEDDHTPATAVYYPTLYGPALAQDDAPPAPEGVSADHSQPYPTPPTAGTPNSAPASGPYPSYSIGPYVPSPYPYSPVGGVVMAPPMPPYPPYQGQHQPPMQMVPVIPYPYYGPPPWTDPQNAYMPPASVMESAYPAYGVPMQQAPMWAPSHPPPPQNRPIPPPQPPVSGPPPTVHHPPQVLHPNAPTFVPQPSPYFNGGGPPQYPQQQMRPPPPVPNHQFMPSQPPTGQRQLWTPNSGKREGSNRNPGQINGQQRPGNGTRTASFTSNASISSLSPSPIRPGLTSQSRSGSRNAGSNGPRDFIKPTTPASAALQATPMSIVAPGSRSRGSSISSTSARSNLARAWGPGMGMMGGMSPASPNGRSFVSNLSSPDPGAPSEIGILLNRPIRALGARRGSGSVSGSGSNGGESGTRTPLDETASVASSSISSASSRRTFTSTSSKHPSLPPRPDWSMDLLHATSSRGSISSQSSTRANPRSGSSNSSNPAHSRSHSSQSHPHGASSYPMLLQTDFPPLPGMTPPVGQSGTLGEHPLMTLIPQGTVWNDTCRLDFGHGSVSQPNGTPLLLGGGLVANGVRDTIQQVDTHPHDLKSNTTQAARALTPMGAARSDSVNGVNFGQGIGDGELVAAVEKLAVAAPGDQTTSSRTTT